jgi:pilus assembly protein Flp/PilA
MRTLAARVQLSICRLLFESDGQGLTEYALILALIALVAIAALTLLGGKVSSELSTVATSVGRSV